MPGNRQSTTKQVAASLVVCLMIAGVLRADDSATQPTIHVPHNQLKKLAWQLAVPAATFADKTVFEAIDLLHAHDIHHLELAPSQLLSADKPGIKVSESMPEDATAALLAKLKTVHMDIVTFGPVEFAADDQSTRDVFLFAKKIKAKTIVASASGARLEQLDKLATEFGINVALQDSNYKSPDDMLSALANRSARVGSDGDLSVWADSVKAMQLLHAHLIQVRMQRVSPDVIAELKAQGFKGVVTIVVTPGTGPAQMDKLVDSVNHLSDALQGSGK